jgi:hypothetical protein
MFLRKHHVNRCSKFCLYLFSTAAKIVVERVDSLVQRFYISSLRPPLGGGDEKNEEHPYWLDAGKI